MHLDSGVDCDEILKRETLSIVLLIQVSFIEYFLNSMLIAAI